MRIIDDSELEGVRGGDGILSMPHHDPGGASEGVCYPAPSEGGVCEPAPDTCYPGGYGYSGHEGGW